jgi:hypothetical protein
MILPCFDFTNHTPIITFHRLPAVLCFLQQTQKPNLFEKNTDSVKSLCRSSCNKCVDACKGAGFKGTQEACKGGNSLSQGGLSSCIGEYQGAKDDKAREAVRSKYSKAPK